MDKKALLTGVMGAAGYAGLELLRILHGHPHVKLHVATSRSLAGQPIADAFPALRCFTQEVFDVQDSPKLGQCDVLFLATESGVAMELAPGLLASGCRIIDLSADFRLHDAHLWGQWYGKTHHAPDLLREAVYGLTEWTRDPLRTARLVANPGCYPTSVLLATVPLAQHGLLHGPVIINSLSGTSGAGRNPRTDLLFSETAGSVRAYGTSGHRHLPEIEQGLRSFGASPMITFLPHIIPASRGIFSTIHLGHGDALAVQSVLQQAYADARFVDIMPQGSQPATGMVLGSNMCRIAVHATADGAVVILSVLDNLIKGAAGQAIQNMNVMFGFQEACGLETIPFLP